MSAMANADQKTILITDEDRGSRESLREVFEPFGFQTVMAESGEEALNLAGQVKIHIAVFEMQLPRLNGLETVEMAQRIRGLWVPTILIAREQNERLLRRALKAQVYCVLGKPVEETLAIRVVNRIFEKFYA